MTPRQVGSSSESHLEAGVGARAQWTWLLAAGFGAMLVIRVFPSDAMGVAANLQRPCDPFANDRPATRPNARIERWSRL